MPHTLWANHLFPQRRETASLLRVKTRAATRHLALWALFMGLVLRAAAPVGYMPASLESGLLFELCPGQLPAGFVLPGAAATHEHHHHSDDGSKPAEPDTCQVGHLLFSAAAVDTTAAADPADLLDGADAAPPVIPAKSGNQLPKRSRGPPA